MEKKVESLEKFLLSLGLTKSEVSVYLTMLQKELVQIPEICKTAGLPRSTVVISLENLLKEGLVRYYIKGKRKNYIANEPKEIFNLLAKKEAEISLKKIEINKIIPDLESLFYVKSGVGAIVENLSGETGFKKAYEMTLDQNAGSEILRFGLSIKKFSFFSEYLKEYAKRKNEKKIKTRMLIPKDDARLFVEVKEDDKNDLRETRFLDEKIYNPQCNTAIWGDYVSYISWDKEFHTTIIKDKYFAEMMKMVFKVIWENNKK
jgi:sugar-specific transcriptional regulator TrmB